MQFDDDEFDNPRFTIHAVRNMTGFEQRTIYYYVHRRMISKAAGAGPSARYSAEHVVRLLVLRTLKERGLSLHQIGAFLDGNTLNDLMRFADGCDLKPSIDRLRRFIQRMKPPAGSDALTHVSLCEGVDLFVSRNHLPRLAICVQELERAAARILGIEEEEADE